MHAFENFMNRLTDMDSGWWPFLYLRPDKSQLIDNRRLLKMSVYFGPLYGAILSLLPFLLKRGEFSLIFVMANVIAMTALFFFFYKYTFALFWNRRARRMNQAQPNPTVKFAPLGLR
jgi:hypothetical protein